MITWRSVDDKGLKRLEERFSIPQGYASGIVVFQQGDEARELFLIRDGLIKLVRNEHNGTEIIIGLRSSGWLVGAAPIVTGQPYEFSAITASVCHLQRLTGNEFIELVESDSRAAVGLCRMIACEMIEHVQRLAEVACLPARLRLEHFLLSTIDDCGQAASSGRVRLQLPLKEWEIARLLSVTPVHLSRLLSQVARDGIIVRDKGWLLVDRQRLEGRVTGPNKADTGAAPFARQQNAV